MKIWPLLFAVPVLLLSSSAFCTDNSQWIGGDNNWLALRVGRDSDGAELVGLDSTFTLPNYSELSLAWARSENELNRVDFHFDHYALAFSTDPFASWSAGIGYEYFGDNGIFEAKDINLGVQYFTGNWLFSAGYINGTVESFFDTRIIQLGLLDANSVKINRQGYELGLAMFFGQWSLRLDGRNMHYDKDLELVRNHPRLQFFWGERALSQIFSLIEWEIDGSVVYQWQARSLRLGYNRNQPLVEQQQDGNFYAAINQSLSPSVSIEFYLSHSTERSVTYGELATHYYW